MTAFDDVGHQAGQAAGTAHFARRRDRSVSDEWDLKSGRLKEEFFSLMDRLADGQISPTDAKVETARINRDMAELIRLTLVKSGKPA